MTEMNDRFAAHTRSASFALTLSQPMIDWLLKTKIQEYLHAKYPWHRHGEINFGDINEIADLEVTPTVRALARRGLVDIVLPDALPALRHEVVRLTRAGRLMAEVLEEAGFSPNLMHHEKVHLHPDDRIPCYVSDDHRITFGEKPPDRRDPADAPYLSSPAPKES